MQEKLAEGEELSAEEEKFLRKYANNANCSIRQCDENDLTLENTFRRFEKD